MKVVREDISLNELKEMSKKMYNELVKAVVDLEQNIMVVDAQLHADEEMVLLEEHESEQQNLWGINLHPDKYGTENWIEFDSMINVRPGEGNRSRGVDNPLLQKKIKELVSKLVKA